MDFGQQYWSVGLVLCLLGGTLWWLRRRGYATVTGGRGRARRLEALERLPLGPQHTLHLVRIGRRVAVLSCSPGGCALLETLPAEESAGGPQ
jgi:flagellar biosynthetic protein FliO